MPAESLDLSTLRAEVATIEKRLNKAVEAVHVTTTERDELKTQIELTFTNGLNTIPDTLFQVGTHGDVIKTDLDGILSQVNNQALIADL